VSEYWRVLQIDHHDPIAPPEAIVRLLEVAGEATGVSSDANDRFEMESKAYARL
jgi:hypothetical protein